LRSSYPNWAKNFRSLGIEILRQVKSLKPEEPQSFLFLADALILNANKLIQDALSSNDRLEEASIKETVQKLYAEALGLLQHVIMGKWDVRFAQVESTSIVELNRLASFIKFHGFDVTHHTLHSVDSRLLCPIVVDLRVMVVWDTDMTDVELHVREPSGERCFCFHNKTTDGGMLSRDFSHGYGPEEYLIRNARSGTYSISVKLFSSMSKYTGTTISVHVWTFYGNPHKEQEKRYTLRLHKDRDEHEVARVAFA